MSRPIEIRPLKTTTPTALLAKVMMISTHGSFDLGDDADAIARDCSADSTPDKLTEAFMQFQEGPKNRH